ncbi:MAG TPA: haloacid dehalogenase-like hydrolase [Candidatus Nanoarchaeia archaeon]|nr:haloacid dehalogenase-like hydrolase [Candidatus Nanoarchaeia archaeon]
MITHNIHIKNKDTLSRKIALFKAHPFHVVSDFDRTLTKAFVDGTKFVSSYALVRDGQYLTPDYPARAHALFEKYHPFEISSTISPRERNEKMVQWWSEHFELMKECGMNKDVIRDIVAQGKIEFRAGALEFLEVLSQHKVPLLIFSAGVGDIIRELLESAGKIQPNVHLLSNFYFFDEQGRVVGKKNDIFIHTFNKNEVEVKKTPYYNEIKQRKNVLLLGDSLGDLGMAEGIEHETIIRIGFLNEDKEKMLEKYMQEFDVVITDDGEMGYVKEIVGEILS